jgi:DNA-binding phage protein
MVKTSSYRQALLRSLNDRNEAAAYLDAALEDSPQAFLKAWRNVAQSLESPMGAAAINPLNESGNPTFETFESLLRALGLRLAVLPQSSGSETSNSTSSQTGETSACQMDRADAAEEEQLGEETHRQRDKFNSLSSQHQYSLNQIQQAVPRDESRNLAGAA